MAKDSKDKRIKQEIDRLQKVFSGIPDGQKTIINGQINRAAFMRVTLEELEALINEGSVVEKYQHGANQSGMKESAVLQAYNSTIKNYTAVIKQLISLLPTEEKKAEKTNALLNIMNK